MVDGPCGPGYEASPCCQNGAPFSKGFPKTFGDETQTDQGRANDAIWGTVRAPYFMSEDILYTAQQQCPSAKLGYTNLNYNREFIQVEDIVLEMGGAALTTYGLPPPVRDGTADLSPEILRESSYCTADLDQYRGGIFFLDAPDGTGITFITEMRRHGDHPGLQPHCFQSDGRRTLFLDFRDFGQALPVIPKKTRAKAVPACLKSSNLCAHVQSLHLTTNMLAHTTGDNGSADFSRGPLAFGEGRTPSDAEHYINVGTLCSVVDTHQQLRDAVFPHLTANYNDLDWLSHTATSVIFVSHCYYTAPDKHFLPPALGVFALLLDFSVKPSRLLPLSSPLHHDHLRCERINNCVKRPPVKCIADAAFIPNIFE
ncbi:unnamed protein product [Acanthosepion pharaonis]|uniref:ATP-dependent DNA helicase n=1 Tax=Acanthosepion pharaonis TaxID=158019 RepID=A0A812C0C2_ACAPH|nr:unnamed protein product [Sepia pharaonis]